MSEVKSRPSSSRGRGSSRGAGRGGFSGRGGRGGSRQANGNKGDTVDTPTYEEEGEIGQLKMKYSSKLITIKEMFPDWTDEDIVFALQETDGDLEGTIERISEGNISQWGEVKKKTKERAQSKPKEPAAPSNEAPTTSTRGGRGRGGSEGVRGGRARGSDRGRGAARGGRGGLTTNGVRGNHVAKADGVPATESDTPATENHVGNWEGNAQADSTPLDSSWEHVSADTTKAVAAEEPKKSSKPDGTRSWASIFNKPAPTPAPSKAPRSILSHDPPVEAPIAAASNAVEDAMPGLPPPPIPVDEDLEVPVTPPTSDLVASDPPANITPSKDELTETNLEQVLDTSGPTASATAASTIASTMDPRTVSDGTTPMHPSQQPSSARPPLGGYSTSAYKAMGIPGRSASYQRKIFEQQEAVVMPGKHAVDRATVQFGSMGLNGTTEDVDVDSDREDAETRAQPPQHSPIAPRAALPPAPPQQAFAPLPQANDTLPTPRPAPGLPPVNQSSSIQPAGQPLSGEQVPPSETSQSSYPYNQLSDRYGPQVGQQETSAPAQKAYEPFGQQIQQAQQYEGYPSTNSQGQAQPQHQNQPHQTGYSSASNDMSSYYSSKNAYQNSYYGSYGQQPQHTNQDAAASQQRVGSAFASSAAETPSQYAASQGPPQHQNRYRQTAEAQTSGHSTPNPSLSAQQQPGQPHQMLHQHAQGQAGGQHGGYPYGHPYYNPAYYSAYMNQVSNNHPYGRERPMFDDARRYDEQYLTQNPQFGYGGGQSGYGGGPFGGAGGKQGMYGQPHQGYGMSPQATYDQHSSSPANAAAFAQQHSASGRESTTAGGLGNYGRSGSAQPAENPQQYSGPGASNHSAEAAIFGRSQPGYPGQSTALGGHVSQPGGNEESIRGYGDSAKLAGGPSPALGQPGGRPGSTATPQGQTSLPPPQGQNQGQQGYGGYMGHQMHGQQGSQYGGGPGGLGGHHQTGGQNHQAGGYGAYGAGYGGNYYGGSNRGGWGANYGH